MRVQPPNIVDQKDVNRRVLAPELVKTLLMGGIPRIADSPGRKPQVRGFGSVI